ncbi:hypothetical protein [Flagellimonas sp.]|uniref:hypothetical protein n=1 Tax=Flagellimonas sp. TaxID=2058762 RepID=UPI003B5BCC44
MKTRKHILLGCMVLIMAVGFISCSAEDGKDGLPGDAGVDGIACWDTNGDGINDTVEDINGDEKWNALDCIGTTGDTGANGDNGISCWDLNANGIGEVGEGVSEYTEDINGDGVVDAKDCQGKNGTNGQPGNDGNANVQKITIDLEPIPMGANSHTFQVSELTEEFLISHTLIFHLEVEFNNSSYYLSIPGFNTGIDRNYGVIFGEGELLLSIRNIDGSIGNGWLDYWEILRITAIEIGTLQNKAGHSDPVKALKAAGVDANDYHAVMQYFGLED